MNKFLAVLFLFCFTVKSSSQVDSLKNRLIQIIKSKKADVGVAINEFEDNDTLSINGNKHFPMQSVYKLHLAIAVLHQVDIGKLSLDQIIQIKKGEILPIGGPLLKKYPEGNFSITLQELLCFTVSQSDNNGCDILFRLMGGTTNVENYLHSIGVKEVSVKGTEEDMCKDWNVQFTNWTTPVASTELLRNFYYGKFLKEKTNSFLWKILTETSTGKKRIKGNLPEGTVVAHKTGTSGTEDGISAAVNDVGIIVLPNGKHIAISVFITNSREDDEVNEKMIADVAKATWDYFIKK